MYVLWANVYDNSVGHCVFTSADPTGPFTEQAVPTLAVNNNAPASGMNNTTRWPLTHYQRGRDSVSQLAGLAMQVSANSSHGRR